jgi:peptidoglycan hydrolase CwlO-like protein
MKKKEVEAAIGDLAGRMDELAAQATRTEAQIERTDAQIEATNKSLKELGEATDKRIGDLVVAIGKLLPNGSQKTQ